MGSTPQQYCVWLHANQSIRIVEIQVNSRTTVANAAALLESGLANLRATRDLFAVADQMAKLTALVTDYDRVMVYRFLEDWRTAGSRSIRLTARARPDKPCPSI